VHFEPQEDSLVVRLRVDGVLHEVQRIPKRMMPGVTTRLKVLAKLDIAERRKPQDGRISLNAAAAGACSTSASRLCRRSRASRS
jgi:type IV pilus assembly protein PilB